MAGRTTIARASLLHSECIRRPDYYAPDPSLLPQHDATEAWRPNRIGRRKVPDVYRWRKAARRRLIEQRLTLPIAERACKAAAVASRLDELVGDVRNRIVAAYWPIRGELNLLDWLASAAERGAICALPVVIEKNRPLVFRGWSRGGRLERGLWNIPVPPAGQNLTPDIVLAPLVGFDFAGYRLGYGGGYFDRTLSACDYSPTTIGVGYSHSAVATIYPQWHDVPMGQIVTEHATFAARTR